MKRTSFNILFYIKRTKLLKTGNAPVYMKLTLNGKSVEISLKRDITPNIWDTQRNKAKGTSEEAILLNEYLTSVRGQLFVYQKNIQEQGKVPTAEILKNEFLGIGDKAITVIQLFSEHNENMKTLVGDEYSYGTYKRYRSSLNHIKSFIKHKYKREDLALSEINNKFITDFEYYLKTFYSCQHNSAMKHLKCLKKITRIAIANDYIRKDPFASFKISMKPINRECLSKDELRKLQEKEISIKRIDIIRDLFVFQCYTGLAYIDLYNLSRDNIQIGIDGNKWIYTKRGKTGTSCHIPILNPVQRIIDKYKNNPILIEKKQLLPVPSNQKMNAYLKEVADICGINKNLHTHLARHTYATTVTLSNGIPIETVSKLLGHNKLQTTQIYAKVLDSKISEDMSKLREKIVI